MKLVVMGDVMLDVDIDGAARRLAPDAPVPVIDDIVTKVRPGGAGLAAAMLARDGAEVTLVAAIGDDRAGRRLLQLMQTLGVAVCNLAASGATPRKMRVRASGQCVTRLDLDAEPPELRTTRVERGVELVVQAKGVLVADYGRGVAALPALRHACMRRGTRVTVWDPHPRGLDPVPGVLLVTPNENEARNRLASDGSSHAFPAGAARAANELRALWNAHAVAVTCGARGAVLAHDDGLPFVVPIDDPAAGDTCGAGDRFASWALAALTSGALPSEAIRDAVRASAAYVRGGEIRSFSRPARRDERPESSTTVATSGCFDLLHAGHVSALRAARALGDRLVVCLNSDASVRRLKGPGRPLVPAVDRSAVLRGLACVDEVVEFDEDTPVRVLERIRPDVFVKGGDYDASTLPEATVLAQWGGRAVIVPYLEGRSTTRIMQEARHVGT